MLYMWLCITISGVVAINLEVLLKLLQHCAKLKLGTYSAKFRHVTEIGNILFQ